MSFDAAWLDLREPADRAARDAGLLAMAQRYAAAVDRPAIVDLGAGTGSTMRALAILGARWRLVDHDERLLAEARRRGGPEVETLPLDLRDVAALPIEDARLVTASALVDLAGPGWIEALADRLSQAQAALYAALSYDGTLRWQPADPEDDAARDAFDRHQRTDKGLGPALGPEGGAYLAGAMRRRGYAVSTAASPWVLGPAAAGLHAELLKGIAQAAGEAGFDAAQAWLERRLNIVAGSSCMVGHVDVLALPPAHDRFYLARSTRSSQSLPMPRSRMIFSGSSESSRAQIR